MEHNAKGIGEADHLSLTPRVDRLSTAEVPVVEACDVQAIVLPAFRR